MNRIENEHNKQVYENNVLIINLVMSLCGGSLVAGFEQDIS